MITFRLYPEPRGELFFEVKVHTTRRAMHRIHKQSRGGEACWSGYDIIDCKKGKETLVPIFGEAHFYRNRLTQKVVTHEMFHATMSWARRLKLDITPIMDNEFEHTTEVEERLAYAHCHLCSEFVYKALKLGLYKETDVLSLAKR